MWNDTTIASFRASSKTTPGELGQAMAKFAANPKDEAAAAALAANPSYVGQTRTTCVATMLEGGHAQNALAAERGRQCELPHLPGREDRRRAPGAGGQSSGEGVEVTVDQRADVERRLAVAQRHRRRGDARRAQVLSGGDDRAPAGLGRHRRPRVPLGRHPDLRRRSRRSSATRTRSRTASTSACR